MDEQLKSAVDKLGAAINDSLSESDRIARAIKELQEAGYDIFFVLDATLGFSKREDEPDASGDVEPVSFRPDGTPRFTSEDWSFLRDLKMGSEEEE